MLQAKVNMGDQINEKEYLWLSLLAILTIKKILHLYLSS